MYEDMPFADVPEGLAGALEAQGFTELTAVQKAVLAPGLSNRDLRISSQTGSGKTVAIGFVLAPALSGLEASAERAAARAAGAARPRALLVAPTRELAAQIGRELSWLYASLRLRIAVVTGGTSITGDLRTLRNGPQVLIGTPGRLRDHLERGALDLSETRAVVLDEADEMLDMGFRDDLEMILDQTPADRGTHLMSATFPQEVLGLARRYQRDAVHVEGTAAGVANHDISHVGMMVRPDDRLDALVNVLLAAPGERTLIFVRTRVSAASLAADLAACGFSIAALSGDMGQRERTATLHSFAVGAVQGLVATDVAARGLDMRDVTRVIHFDLPETSEGLVHRSGRTGRAGNKGTSIAFVTPMAQRRASSLFRNARVRTTWQPVPTPEQIRSAADARLLAEVAAESRGDAGASVVGDAAEDRGEAVVSRGSGNEHDQRTRALAHELLASCDAVDVVAALLARSRHAGPCEPRVVRALPSHAGGAGGRDARPGRGPRAAGPARPERHRDEGSFTSFSVSWGASHGANPSRLLAMVCRRGGVRSNSIGAIRVGEHRSTVDVASHVADDFAAAARHPDARNPAVTIRPAHEAARSPRDKARSPREGARFSRDGGKGPLRKGRPRFGRDDDGSRKANR